MQSPALERRSRRSPWASEALHLQLLRAVQQHELQALVLSDALGQVWAASSRTLSSPPLSPGPLADDGPDLQRCDRRGVAMLVQRLRVGPAVLYLSAQHGAGEGEAGLKLAAAGVVRILNGLL